MAFALLAISLFLFIVLSSPLRALLLFVLFVLFTLLTLFTRPFSSHYLCVTSLRNLSDIFVITSLRTYL